MGVHFCLCVVFFVPYVAYLQLVLIIVLVYFAFFFRFLSVSVVLGCFGEVVFRVSFSL